MEALRSQIMVGRIGKSHLKWVKRNPQEQHTWAQPKGHPPSTRVGLLFEGCSWELGL